MKYLLRKGDRIMTELRVWVELERKIELGLSYRF